VTLNPLKFLALLMSYLPFSRPTIDSASHRRSR
jgi:hypothetical protein